MATVHSNRHEEEDAQLSIVVDLIKLKTFVRQYYLSFPIIIQKDESLLFRHAFQQLLLCPVFSFYSLVVSWLVEKIMKRLDLYRSLEIRNSND